VGPGFKYHVVTVAAIFFALTVGLVVGSLYVSPQLADRQTRAIRDLRTTLITDIAQQRQQIARYQDFVTQARPILLKKKLENRNVAIIQLGDYPETVTAVREALTEAGAKILSQTELERTLNIFDDQLLPLLQKLHAEDPRIPETRAEFFVFLASLLDGSIALPEDLVTLLIRERLIQSDTESRYNISVPLFVVISGSRLDTDRANQVDIPLIEALLKAKRTVVACEPQDASVSDFLSYRVKDLELPLVERVETEMGSCALVFALRGEKLFANASETAK